MYMKVLWLINAPIPALCERAGLPVQVKEGWIDGLYNSLMALVKEKDADFKLAIAFPQFAKRETIEGELDGNEFYGFYKEEDKPYKYNTNVEERLRDILAKAAPDVVHIAGTEYDHAAAMVRAFGRPDRTVVSIQGLTSVYARHYMADLPVSVRYGFTLRDVLKLDNLFFDRKKYYKRGALEKETIRGAGHIIGRTDWDNICTRLINPDAGYYYCSEILRKDFYDGSRWSADNCDRHTIFVSQGYYPIKGLHYMLEALKDIRKFYPDVKLRVAGGVSLNDEGFKNRLRQKNYQRYLSKLIVRYNLSDCVEFLPPLKADEMKKMYLRSNVFVSPSSIENSPNSLGEAMMLGVPCVSSLVGGVGNMLIDGVEGFFYQHDAPYMLAFYVMRIFETQDSQREQLMYMTDAAHAHAERLFDRRKNAQQMLEIYGKLQGDKSESENEN